MKLASATCLLFIVLVIVCCSKNNSLFSASTVFHKPKKEVVASIKLFAQSGEITDASIVNRFFYRDSFTISTLTNYFGNLESVLFLSDQKAQLTEGSQHEDYDFSIWFKDITFTASDTSVSSSAGEVFTRSLPYYIGLHKPTVYREYISSSTAGFYLFGYTYQRQYYFMWEGERLKLPWVLFLVHGSSVGYSSGRVQNKLDRNFYHSLAAADTVVVQEYAAIYEK